MPSANKGKRKVPIPKKQKSKNKKPRPVKKKPPHFRCGRQTKPKPVTKTGRSNLRKSTYTPLNSSRTLQQLRQDKMYMTTKARGIMISFVKHLYKWVSTEAERLRQERKRPSIGFIEMRTALRSVMPGKCTKCMESSYKGRSSRHMKAS